MFATIKTLPICWCLLLFSETRQHCIFTPLCIQL